MVDVCTSIRDYLKSHPSVDFPVYIDSRPREVNDCITLVLNGGSDSTFFFGYPKTIIKPMVAIYVRSSSYGKGYAEICKVIQVLKQYTDATNNINGVSMIGNISSLGHDDQRRSELLIVYNVLAEE